MAGQTMPLGAGVTTIGRAEDNDVVMEDSTASRHHARISLQGGQFFVEDEGSGTLVEVAPATRTLLASGATLQVGETQVMFMQAGPSSLAGTAAGQAGTLSGSAGRASSAGVLEVDGVDESGEVHRVGRVRLEDLRAVGLVIEAGFQDGTRGGTSSPPPPQARRKPCRRRSKMLAEGPRPQPKRPSSTPATSSCYL